MSNEPGWRSPAPPPPPAPPGGGGAFLRPMNVGDVLDGMFRLFMRHWKAYLAAIAAIVVPTQLLLSYLQRDLVSDVGVLEVMSDPMAAQAAAAGEPALGDLGAGFGLGILVALLITPLQVGVASLLGTRAHLREDVDAGPALRAGLRRWWALVAATVLSWLAVMVAALVFLLPLIGVLAAGGDSIGLIVLAVPVGLLAIPAGMAVYTLFLVAPVAIIIEQRGPLAGLRRSASLVRRRFWAVLGIGLLAWIIALVVGTVFTWPFGIPAILFGGMVALVLTTAGGIVGGILSAPLMPNALALLYLDLRVRGEGLDLEAMTTALEQPGEWSGPA